MSKGDKRRPCLVSREEEGLHWLLALRKITRKKFDKAMKELKLCPGCNKRFEKFDDYVVDVGTDFGPEFVYECPYCGCTKREIEG